jgi:cytoskeletal protein RodZ
VASFGQKLRQAREARNITLQEIAAATKIGTRALQALEWERFEQLPGGIFNKGFVRAYARCVGLDEEETVAAYMEAAKVDPPETDMLAVATQVEASRPLKRGGGPNAATVVGVFAVLVALGLGALWLKEHRKEMREQAEAQQREARATVTVAPTVPPPPVAATTTPPDATTTPAVAPNVDPAQNAATQPAPQSMSPLAKQSESEKLSSAPATDAQGTSPVEVTISATEPAWISVARDGKRAETVTLDPSKPEMTNRSYKAKDKVKLILGNPTGVIVTYNGKPAGELGKAGQRAIVTFTPEGIEKN